jgi:hypothetical protein
VRAFGAGSGLDEGQGRSKGGDGAVLGKRHVLGMSPKPVPAVAEYPVTDREGRDRTPHRLDHAGELVAEDGPLRPPQPGDGTHEEGLRGTEPAIGSVHSRGVHPHKQLVVSGDRLIHVDDAYDLGRTVTGVDGGLHL